MITNLDDLEAVTSIMYYFRLIKENVTDTAKEQHESIPIEGFVNIYSSLDMESMRAPCRYIGFIKTYFHIVSQKKETLVQRKNMLTVRMYELTYINKNSIT